MAPSDSPSCADTDSREAILAMLEETIADIHQRRRDADAEADDDLQIKRARTVGYLANQYRKLRMDRDLDEMQDELALLKEDRRDA